MTISPGKYNPLQPDIELFDYKTKKRYGLKLDGSGALQVGTLSQDDTVHIRAGGKRIGDFDEQRDWKGGRGIEDLSSNPNGYWDAKDAWTLTPGHVHQTLLWQFARGLRSCEFSMPSKTKSLTWKAIVATGTGYAIPFTPATAFTVSYSRMWIRKVGNPGPIRFYLMHDDSGSPGTANQLVDTQASEVTDVLSVLKKFTMAPVALAAGTQKWLAIMPVTGTHNKANHWEIGGYDGGSSGKITTDTGASWSAANFDPFYYIADADVNRTFFSFFLDDAMYVVSKNDNKSASKLWINGDRGKATAGAAGSLTDSGKSWVTNRWFGARVAIIRGTGKGQTREITSNIGTQLAVSPNWDTNPSTDSEYIIYGTEWFTEISAGLNVVESQPIVVNQIVYIPQGSTNYIRRMIWTGTTHSFSYDGTNYAGFMARTQDASGVRVWRALQQLSYASAVAWANPPTNLTFGTAYYVGDLTGTITNLAEKDGLLYIFKDDGVWSIPSYSTTGLLTRISNGIDKTPSLENGRAVLVHQQFLYYSWLHSIIRVYGSSHDDIGQDWSGKGLPDTREGNIVSMDSYISLLICAIDAGTGTSSVLGFDGIGWHELIRAYDSNKRIRFVKVQPCADTRNRQWTDIGGDLVYQEMPYKKSSPRLDTGARYQHEAVIESAAIDMGTASSLPKFIKELTVYCENLGEENEVSVDYQIDDDVHTSSWTPASTLYESPESTAFLGLSNIRKFAYRLRINSSDNTAPVDIQGVVPNGYARVPYKMVWTLRCRADNITSRGRLVKPDELMRWLLDNARYPGRLEMRSQYSLAHEFFVIIHPPRMFPYKPAQNGQAEESVFTLVLEES